MPEWYIISVVALFGLIIGSFLNVVIYRLHTGRSLNDRSHCLSCGTTLNWYELFPVVSYLTLLGRCRTCGAFIPYRYALVEILTAVTFVICYLFTSDIVTFVLVATLMSVLIVGLVYDLYHMIIPDEVSGWAAALAVAIVGWQAYLSSDWLYVVFNALSGAAIIFLVFWSLWFFSGGRAFGFGDAKLSVSLGMLVGLSGVFSLMVFSFWIGAIFSILLILLQKIIRKSSGKFGWGHVNMKSEIPFAPFMIVAFVVVYFFRVDVIQLISSFVEKTWL